MRENNSKQSNWQIINLKNIQAALAAQFQKNKRYNKKKKKKTISLTSGAGKTGQPLVKEWN